MKVGRDRDARTFACTTLLAVTIAVGACGGESLGRDAATDASGNGGHGGSSGTGGTGASRDAQGDAKQMCSYPDGGAPADGGAFNGVCPSSGCPSGTVCVAEVGGVAGGGGEYCAPIPNECHGTPTCACMASCVCTNGFGGRPETCTEQNGSIGCDNGIR
jgi:hypothetical protein